MQEQRAVKEMIDSFGRLNQPLSCFATCRKFAAHDLAVCLESLNRCFFAENPLEPFLLLKKKFLKSQYFLFGSVRFTQFHRHPRMQNSRIRNHFNILGDFLSCYT